MIYDNTILYNKSLKYLIKEGFVKLKLVLLPNDSAKVILDASAIENFKPNLNLKELEILIQDAEFVEIYAKKIDESGDTSESWKNS